MAAIKQLLKKRIKNQEEDLSSHPQLFNLQKSADKKELVNLLEKDKQIKVVDYYKEQLEELRLVKKPSLLKKMIFQRSISIDANLLKGMWVYFPWKKAVVHILKKSDYYKLRTSRNHDLILSSEQKKLKDKIIAVAGLNVGNPGAICFVLEGIGSYFKFADFDELSVTNLNRFRAGLVELGINKSILSTRQAYEVDPYIKVDLFDEGVKPDKIDKFLLSPKADILIEETDNLKLKIDIRKHAKKHGIPVVMVTGNGQNVIIDVERYDTDKKLEVLDGRLQKRVMSKIFNISPADLSLEEKMQLARDFMGAKILHQRLVKSFKQIGKTITGIPQLSESSYLRGGALCYFARRILLKQRVPSGRYFLDMDKLIK